MFQGQSVILRFLEVSCLEKSLDRLAHFLETRTNDSILTMIRFLEPALLVVLSVFVGLFMLAIYWPIFELGNVVGIA